MKVFFALVTSLTLAAAGYAEPPTKKPSAPAADETKKPSAPAADEISAADVQKYLAFFDKLVDTVVAAKDVCPKMATDINKLVDDNQPLLKAAQETQDKGKKLPKAAEDHVMAGMAKLLGGMQKCQRDKAVQAALARLTAKK